MNKQYFNVSYQGVREFFNVTVFLGILWYVLSKYFMLITDSKNYELLLKEINAVNSFNLMLLILTIVGLIWILYHISAALVSLAYWFLGYKVSETKWYPYLTEYNIKIPLTKKHYWSIKDHSKFIRKYLQEDKPQFDSKKLEEWAKKIIEKEINNLVKGKTTKRKKEIKIPLKENLQWNKLK